MPIRIERNREGNLAVAVFFGVLDEAEIMEAVKLAFFTGNAEPGVDRIVFIDPSAEIHRIDSAALRRIQRCVHEEEKRGGQEVAFRTVFVHSAPLHTPILQLYKAVWDECALPGVEFFVASSLAEASRYLGLRLQPGILDENTERGS